MRLTRTSAVAGTLALLVAVAMMWYAHRWSPAGAGSRAAEPSAAGPVPRAATVPPSTVPTPSVAGSEAPVPMTEAVTAAVDAAARRGITQNVLVADRRTGGPVLAIRADVPVPAMSLVKLFFAVDVLDTAGGPARVDPATLALLHRMIATSDDMLASRFYLAGGEGQIIERLAARYHLTGTRPSPKPRFWGDIHTTAADLVSFLTQTLADPRTGPFLTRAMRAASDVAADGLNQDFGMNAVPGAGSKQGWGCCLGGVVAVHSVGFTAGEIVVVLSTAAPDAPGLSVAGAREFTADPGFRASVAAVTATARAATVPPAPPTPPTPAPASPGGAPGQVFATPTPLSARMS